MEFYLEKDLFREEINQRKEALFKNKVFLHDETYDLGEALGGTG